MLECPRCGEQYPLDDRFCSKCGALLQEPGNTPDGAGPKKSNGLFAVVVVLFTATILLACGLAVYLVVERGIVSLPSSQALLTTEATRPQIADTTALPSQTTDSHMADDAFMSGTEACLPRCETWLAVMQGFSNDPDHICSEWIVRAVPSIAALRECWMSLPTPTDLRLLQARSSMLLASDSWKAATGKIESFCTTGSLDVLEAALPELDAAYRAMESANSFVGAYKEEQDGLQVAETGLAAEPPLELNATTIAIPSSQATDTPLLVTVHIVFESLRDDNYEIYVMNADGSDVTRLTNNPAVDSSPAWSPNGKLIAFDSDRDGDSEIYVMNADGSGVRNLTNNTASDGSPAWSPDGSHLAFWSDRDGNPEIYVMNADGNEAVRLTNNLVHDFSPSWSPDGSHIAFESWQQTADWQTNIEICVMNADGSGQRNLTNSSGDDRYPSWSPDGSRIAFESDRGGNTEIYVMNSDGSEVTRLTDRQGRDHDGDPSWSPDGNYIVFDSTSGSGGSRDIYMMDADGGGVTRLTSNPASDTAPSWSPR